MSVGPAPDNSQNFKRIEVIEDDESQIIEAVRRMSDRYDFVVTRHAPFTHQHTPAALTTFTAAE